MGRRLGLEKLSGSVPVPEKSDVTELEVEQQVNKNINVHNDSAHCSQSNPNLYISSSANSTVRQTGGHRQTDRQDQVHMMGGGGVRCWMPMVVMR